MKEKLLTCLFALFFSGTLFAQQLTISVDKKGKVGFCDQNGKVVVKHQYDSAFPFSNGVAVVMKGKKYGVINEAGKIVLPLKYSSISSWTSDLFLVNDGKKVGLASYSGIIVLPVKYSYISKPNCYDRALIALGGKTYTSGVKSYRMNAKYGIINSRGAVMVEAKYKGLYEFSLDASKEKAMHEGKRLDCSNRLTNDTLLTDCKYLGFSKGILGGQRAGLLDENGNQLIKEGMYNYILYPKNDMVRYYITSKKQTICGYYNLIDRSVVQVAVFTKPMADITFWTHGDFTGELAPVNGKIWKFVNKAGKEVRSGYTSLIHSEYLRLWAAKEDNKWIVFDENNSDVKELSGYEYIGFPYDKNDKAIFSVSRDGKYGCIDKSGKTIIPFEYDQIMGNRYDCFVAKKKDMWGVLSIDNKVLVPCSYNSIYLPICKDTEHFWVEKADGLCYHYNILTRKESAQGYKSIANFRNGFARVVPTDFSVDKTNVNLAQQFVPDSSTKNILNKDIDSSIFGYILDVNDNIVFDRPVSTIYHKAVVDELIKLKGRKPTEAEKKDIILRVTQNNRSYMMETVISEDDWNY